MTDRWLKVSLAITGLVALAIQVWMTASPDQDEIRQITGQNRANSSWQQRIAPEIEVPMLDGSTFRLADHVGQRVIVVNFFATWCGPCRAEMPELQRFIRTLATTKEQFTFVAIDVEERRALIERFIEQLSLAGMPIGLDESGAVAKRFGVSAYPTTVVIGADGRVKLYETGAISNADVSLMPVMTPEFGALRQGRGITREAYRAEAARAPQVPPARHDDEPELGERGRHIADTMTCPCGCSDTVRHCGCHTSKSVKEKLAAELATPGDFAKLTDAEIKTALNREFCMKGM